MYLLSWIDPVRQSLTFGLLIIAGSTITLSLLFACLLVSFLNTSQFSHKYHDRLGNPFETLSTLSNTAIMPLLHMHHGISVNMPGKIAPVKTKPGACLWLSCHDKETRGISACVLKIDFFEWLHDDKTIAIKLHLDGFTASTTKECFEGHISPQVWLKAT